MHAGCGIAKYSNRNCTLCSVGEAEKKKRHTREEEDVGFKVVWPQFLWGLASLYFSSRLSRDPTLAGIVKGMDFPGAVSLQTKSVIRKMQVFQSPVSQRKGTQMEGGIKAELVLRVCREWHRNALQGFLAQRWKVREVPRLLETSRYEIPMGFWAVEAPFKSHAESFSIND